MYLDLLAVAEEEKGAAPLLPEHLQERGSPEPEEPVGGTGRHDTHLAGRAHPRIAVDLDEYFSLQDAQDLVGVVVAMEVSDVVGRNGLHPHDQTLQPVLRAGDHADVAGSGRERHLSRFRVEIADHYRVPITIAAGALRVACDRLGGTVIVRTPEKEETSMGLLRRRGGDGGTKYRMREKVFAIGDDFWVENDAGERAFKVDGKALRIRDTLVLEDASGAELYTVQEKKLHIRDTMEIERNGHTVATVKKALISPLRDRFSIEVEDGEDMQAKGNIVDHEYKIERDGEKVAEVSKRWFRIRDTYGIEIAPGQEDALILAVTVCIDRMGRS
jgi:uncharacterized protein YxjI